MEEKDTAASGSFSLSENDSPQPALSVPFVDGAGSAQPIVNTVENSGMNLAILAVAAHGGGSGDPITKKKRGRPRKYDADGNLRVPYVSSPPGFTLTSCKSKKGRGCSSGTGNWKFLASLGELFTNTAGGDFTPHVVTVYPGEDIASMIMSFSQKGHRGICVLSANGAVSNVTIKQAGSSGGIMTYEGSFEILSLTGSFTVTDKKGMRSRTGGLSVSLAGPDGRVIGGSVAGLLKAASPIQIVVGSFMPNSFAKAQKKKQQSEQRISTITDQEPVTAATPISQVAANNNIFSAPPPTSTNQFTVQSRVVDEERQLCPNGIQNLNVGANNSNTRPSPDINLSVHVELN